MKEKFSLNILRGMSALVVCATHLRGALFIDFSTLQSEYYIVQFFYFITSLGHQAVVIFFVLSGYLIANSVMSSIRFDIYEYLIKRLSRLWIVLIPSLIITLLVTHIIQIINPGVLRGELFSVWHSGPDANFSVSTLTFIGNLFFQQGILVPIFGVNSPLWSLTNEFWYYLIFGLTVSVIKNEKNRAYLNCIIIILAFIYLPIGLITYFFFWLLGGLVSWYINNGSKFKLKSYHIYLSTLSIIGSLVLSKLKNNSGNLSILLCDSLLTISILYFIFATNFYSIKKYEKLVKFFSDISYTLYLTHFPFVLLISVLFYSAVKVEPSIKNIFYYSIWLLTLILIAYVLWCLFEKNTKWIQNYLVGKYKKYQFLLCRY